MSLHNNKMSENSMKVYFVSDGTAITAEVFGSAMLSFFDIAIRKESVPFISTEDQAHGFCRQLQEEVDAGEKVMVFFTILSAFPAFTSVRQVLEDFIFNNFDVQIFCTIFRKIIKLLLKIFEKVLIKL